MKSIFNKIAIILIAIFLLLMNIPPKTAWNDLLQNEKVQAAAPSKPTGSSGSYLVNVTAEAVKANPSVYWSQLDDLSFEATKDGGKVTSQNSGNNTPNEKEVKNTIDLTQYNLPSSFQDENRQKFSRAALTKMYLKNDSVKFYSQARSFKGISLTKNSDTKFVFVTKTGAPNIETEKKQYGKNKKGQPKYTVRYDTPVDIKWYGEVLMQAEVRVVEDSKMVVGQKKNFKLQLRTKEGALPWTSWNDTAAATWSSDKSSVASVNSTGQVTASAKGQAKISATWKKNDYHLIASANVTVTAEDALSVTGKLDACFKDGSTTLKATLYQAGGKSSDVTSTATWTSSNTSVATVSKGVVTFKKVGSTTIKVTSNGKTESVKVTTVDCTIVPLPTPTDPSEPSPPPPPPPPFNEPPIVEIEGPSKVIVGELVCYKAIAEDSDGIVELYEWDEELNIMDSANKGEVEVCGIFKNVGEEPLIVQVRDNGNEYGEDKKWAYTVKNVTVVTPQPTAYVEIEGTLKENRQVIAIPSDPYNGNKQAHKGSPIVKQTLTIEAVEDENKSKVFIQENISGNVVPYNTYSFLGKFSGDVKVTSYVENSNGEKDTFETIITLAPDVVPSIDFDTPTLIYREKSEINGQAASADIILNDFSHSVDDEIQKRIWRVKYDSNNDGNFNDEEWKVISDTNERNVKYNTALVGKYLLELEIFEKFSQPTLSQFVDLTFNKETTDLKFNDSSTKAIEQKIVEVDNLAPLVSLDTKEKLVAEIQFDAINSPYPQNVLESNLPYLKNLLAKENIDLKLGSVDFGGRVKQVAAGDSHTFYLLDNGTVYAIQDTHGNYGQIGNGTTPSTSLVKIDLTGKVREISTSNRHTHFLMEDGSVYATGNNQYGQLGDGTYTNRYSPVKITLPSKVKQVTNSDLHTHFLLEDGTVYATGWNHQYQLGNTGTFNSVNTPIKINLPSKAKYISNSAGFFTHFLMEDGTVYAAGTNTDGELGDGTKNDTRGTITKVILPSSEKVKQIASSEQNTLFLMESGSLYASGKDYGTTPSNRNFPFKTTQITINYQIEHYLTDDGKVYSAGYNGHGQFGNGNINYYYGSPQLSILPLKAKSIDSTSFKTYFLLEDGTVYGTGLIIESVNEKELIPIKVTDFEIYSMYKNSNSTLFTVGLNQKATLDYYKRALKDVTESYFVGAGIPTNKTVFESVIGWNENRGQFINIQNMNVQKFYDDLAKYIISVMGKKQVDVQYDAIDSPYSEAQLKSMTPLLNSLLNDYGLKANVSFMSNSVSKTISSGYGFTHFITRDGSVYATGHNNRGQLGDGTTIDKKTPVKLNLSNVVQISSGFNHTHFLTKDGYVYATGSNDAGKLGLSHSEPFISTPEKVNISNVIQISSGSTHTYFLTKDGDVYVAGSNYYGQAGIGNRSVTYGIEKLNIPKVKQIASQENTTHFLLQSGAVMATGRNESIYGFIGDGRNENVYTPKTIISGDVAQISSGSSFTHFIMNDGSVYATGFNVSGQLGDGTTVTKRNYVKVDLLNVAQISSGRNSTLFLRNDGSIYISGISTVSGNNTLYGTPTKINIPNVLEVSTGYVGEDTWHLLLQDGSIFAAGNNEYGQIGDDTTSNKTVLTKIGFTNPPKNTVKFKTSQNPVYMAFISNKNESYEDLVTKKNNVEGYFIGATRASNKVEIDKLIKANGNKGMYYDIGSTYNNTNLETYIRDFANYIIETQAENSIEVEVLLDSASGIDTAALQSKLDTTFKELIAPDETIINFVEQADGTYKEVESIVPSTNVLRTRIKTLDNKYNFENTHLDGTNRFVVALKTNAYTADVQKHITAANLVNNAYFIGLGKSANKMTIDNVVNASMKKGTYLEFTNVDDALTDLANYILTTIEKNRGIKELFVTTDDEVNYFTTYSDYEDDPQFADYWKMKHERGYFESENGTILNNDAKVTSLIKQFDYTGRYQPKYAAQDNPLTRFSTVEIPFFEDYRKWSDEADNWRIYVHKAPTSDFTFTLNATTGAYTVTNKAMDSDKASINVGYGAGLQAQAFTWKLEDDADWQEGLPSGDLVANQTYQIRNAVIDLQGEKSVTTKLLSRQNLPPVALFKTDKQTYSKNEDVLITNTSYDPNSDNLTATWTYKYKHNDDSTYKALTTGALTGEKANAGWNPTLAKVACEPSDKNKTCTVVIQLVVTDIHGLSDSTTREITINNSNKPIVDFETDKLVYEQEENVIITNKSKDDDNDDMTATWSIKPKDGGSYKQFATGEFKDGKAITDWHTSIPQITCAADDTNESCFYIIKLVIVDEKGETDETTREIEVVNNKPPVADFETNKAVYKNKEKVVITNKSVDSDKDNMTAVWQIKTKNEPDSAYTEFATGEYKNNSAQTGWHPTLASIECPANFVGTSCYFVIKLTVTDAKGKTDFTTREIEVLNNKPPVAQFTTDKTLYTAKSDVVITNTSTDPDNDDMSAEWFIKLSTASDSSYKKFGTGAFTSNKAEDDWNPVYSNITCPDATTASTCSYTIKLIIRDENGATDETTRTINVEASASIEVGVKSIEVYTAKAEQGLPVYMQLDDKVLINNASRVEEALDSTVRIDILRNGTVHGFTTSKVSKLLDGLHFSILPTGLVRNTAYDFTFVITNPGNNEIEIAAGADKITVRATTAEERIINSAIDATYQGQIVAKRTINQPQLTQYETIKVETAKLQATVTGLGHALDQSFVYTLPVNQHYKTAATLFNSSSALSFDSKLIDSYYQPNNIVNDRAIVNTVKTKSEATSNAAKSVITETLSYPKIFVEKNTGFLFSEMQKNVADTRITQPLIDGGHKLYTPIWLDQIGTYDISYVTGAMGVNKVSFTMSQDLKLEAYLFLHANSNTKDKDNFFLEPVNKSKPFSSTRPPNWTEEDERWLMN